MKPRGFTIVELLIAIAIIGILAGISTVAYNGIQQRARLQVARLEMQTMALSVNIFKVTNDRNPISASDFSAVLKDANMYDSTRTASPSYAICASADGYVFAAWNPVVGSIFNGNALNLYSSSGGQTTQVLSNSSLNSTNSIDKVCNQLYPAGSLAIWTYDVP